MIHEKGMLDEIGKAFVNLVGEEEIKKITDKAIQSGVAPLEIVQRMKEGIEIVGEKYENGEFFLSELIRAGMIAADLVQIIKPHLSAAQVRSKGKIVIGTVRGDIHDIGKNIVAIMLTVAGFTVDDIGVDVSAEKIVEKVKSEKPSVLALSCLLTNGMDEYKKVIDILKKTGFRKKVKVLVGGRPITSDFAKKVGADGYAKDAVEAIKITEILVGEL